jgi:predicted Rossmann-fold nucleotide-binding protein
MSNQSIKKIFDQKKRRVVGEIITPGELKNSSSWLSLHGSSKEQLLTYESRGLVAAVSGSGSLSLDHPNAQEAIVLGKFISQQGGLIMSGGRSAGIMEAVAVGAQDNYMGIIFPEVKGEASKKGTIIVVNSPAPRVELLATCAPIIVIFRGGLGTLMVLMRSIVHLRNRRYHPEQLPQVIFVNNYWIGLLTTMMNMGCLPKEFLSELQFFDKADQIINKINPLIQFINK